MTSGTKSAKRSSSFVARPSRPWRRQTMRSCHCAYSCKERWWPTGHTSPTPRLWRTSSWVRWDTGGGPGKLPCVDSTGIFRSAPPPLTPGEGWVIPVAIPGHTSLQSMVFAAPNSIVGDPEADRWADGKLGWEEKLRRRVGRESLRLTIRPWVSEYDSCPKQVLYKSLFLARMGFFALSDSVSGSIIFLPESLMQIGIFTRTPHTVSERCDGLGIIPSIVFGIVFVSILPAPLLCCSTWSDSPSSILIHES